MPPGRYQITDHTTLKPQSPKRSSLPIVAFYKGEEGDSENGNVHGGSWSEQPPTSLMSSQKPSSACR